MVYPSGKLLFVLIFGAHLTYCRKDWLQSNIDRLSLTFGRRVYGIHNPTDGIIFDIIQCLVGL
jgi:hypothetical protein